MSAVSELHTFAGGLGVVGASLLVAGAVTSASPVWGLGVGSSAVALAVFAGSRGFVPA